VIVVETVVAVDTRTVSKDEVVKVVILKVVAKPVVVVAVFETNTHVEMPVVCTVVEENEVEVYVVVRVVDVVVAVVLEVVVDVVDAAVVNAFIAR
jgi:hypothetical protein